jgi:hypothetical protein
MHNKQSTTMTCRKLQQLNEILGTVLSTVLENYSPNPLPQQQPDTSAPARLANNGITYCIALHVSSAFTTISSNNWQPTWEGEGCLQTLHVQPDLIFKMKEEVTFLDPLPLPLRPLPPDIEPLLMSPTLAVSVVLLDDPSSITRLPLIRPAGSSLL